MQAYVCPGGLAPYLCLWHHQDGAEGPGHHKLLPGDAGSVASRCTADRVKEEGGHLSATIRRERGRPDGTLLVAQPPRPFPGFERATGSTALVSFFRILNLYPAGECAVFDSAVMLISFQVTFIGFSHCWEWTGTGQFLEVEKMT